MAKKSNLIKIIFRLDRAKLIAIHASVVDRIKRFIISHIMELEILVIIAALLYFLTRLPYFNILLEKYVIYFLFIVSTTRLFRIPKRLILLITLVLFLPMWRFNLSGDINNAENMGNLIYFLLWYVAILYSKAK